jgi:hypothetical protein
VSTRASLTPGERVKCQLPEWKSAFKGLVNRVNGDGTFCIHFDDGEIREGVEERYLEKIVIVVYQVGEVVEVKCNGWTKYYDGTVVGDRGDGKYDIDFPDGEKKKGISFDRMRKKAAPRESTKTNSGLTFAAWKRGGASSVYGNTAGYRSRPSSVPLSGTKSSPVASRSVYVGRTDGSNRNSIAQRPASAIPNRQTMKDYPRGKRPQSAGVARSRHVISNVDGGKPLPITRLVPDSAKTRRELSQYTAEHVDPFMGPLLSAIMLDKPQNVAEYVLKFSQNFVNNSVTSEVNVGVYKKDVGKTHKIGDRVEAKCEGWTKYYSGEIINVNDDRTYDIKFDDGDRKKCVTEDQLKVDGGTSSGAQPAAVGKKERKKGDRVRAKCKGWNKYYGGEIIHVDSRNGTFSIKFDDGERKAGVTEEELEQTVEDPGYKVGDRIEAKCKGWTKYFAGNITHDHGNGTYDLSFDDGDKKKKVPHTQIKLAPPKPKPKKRKQVMNYKVGDRVEAKATGWKEHYQGEINAVDDEEGVYTIHFDDGEKKNDIQEFQVRKILTEVYAVGDVVDVKCPGWSRHYRGKVEYVNPNRTYNIQFEDGELKRGVRTIEIKGKSSGSSLSGLSETAEAKLKAWSTDEKLVGDFIAKVIDMVGDEDFIPRHVFKSILIEDAGFECSNIEFEELCDRFGDAKGDNINCVEFVEYVQVAADAAAAQK